MLEIASTLLGNIGNNKSDKTVSYHRKVHCRILKREKKSYTGIGGISYTGIGGMSRNDSLRVQVTE
jgi:hypothetical protein